jgi:hypothetical protein
MNAELIRIAERKASLLAKIGRQRTELAQATAPWHEPLALVDKGLLAVRYLKCHPVLLVGLAVVSVALRPKFSASCFQRGWMVWKMALAVKRRLSGL